MDSQSHIELSKQYLVSKIESSVMRQGQTQGNSNNDMKQLKVNKKTDQNIKKKDEQYQLQYFESDNTRAFQLIDQMHLDNLDEILSESSTRFKQFVKNTTINTEKLQERSTQIEQTILKLHEEDDKSEADESEKPKAEREYQTSQMIEVPGQLPRLIKKVIKNSDMNLAKIKDLLATQRQLVDSLQNSIREIVSKINPYALGSMNVKGKQPLEELFELLFELLYGETKDKFVWKSFKYTALLNDDGSADFLYRLANYDMKKVTKEQVEKIKKNKDSSELKTYLEDHKLGELLIDIADWLEFIFNGVSLMDELAEIEELYADAKQTVEVQERKQRKQAFIEGLKQQRISEYQNQQEFLNFITGTLGQMKENYKKTQDKLKNHITYQTEVIAGVYKIERSKLKQ